MKQITLKFFIVIVAITGVIAVAVAESAGTTSYGHVQPAGPLTPGSDYVQ